MPSASATGVSLHATDHVAKGENRRLAGLVVLVDLDETFVGQLHSGVLQAEVVQHRPPSGGVEHAVRLQYPAVLEGRGQAAIGLLVDTGDVAVELQVEPLLAQFVAQVLTHAAVEAAQEQVATVEQGGLGAQAVEDRGELYGDVAAADHQHAARQALEEERLVGGDRVFLARNLRHLRPAAGGDENVPGAEALAVHLDAVRVEQAGVAFEKGHPAVHQQVAIDAVEAVDLAVLVADQGRPVEARLAGAPAIGPGLFEVFAVVRAVDQQLLRYATDVDAGAAQVAALRHRDAGTEAGGETGGADAPGAGADDEQIEIERHVPTPGSDAFQHNPFPAADSCRIGAKTCRNGSARSLASDGLSLSEEVIAMSPTLTHLALHVPDLDACIAFYETFCGMRVIHRRPGKGSQIVWMAEPGQEHRFIFVIMPGGQPRNLASDDYSHFGFALSSRAAVDDLARRAEAAGCLVWAPRDEPYPVGYYCGLRDPAGNYVEFSYGQPLGPGSEALPIP